MDDPPDTTRLALDRTVLANERTYAAWIRTGLAALAAGLGLARLVRHVLPPWSVRLLALLLVGFGAGAFVVSAWRYHHLHVAMEHLDVRTIPRSLVKLASGLLVVCSGVALAALWALTR
ncbi:MAG: DUF202 domain-containing protein [Nitrospirae bacterium]|nr:MAG: DUF202 domain-containing protein [Nitrospirota bacterium]